MYDGFTPTNHAVPLDPTTELANNRPSLTQTYYNVSLINNNLTTNSGSPYSDAHLIVAAGINGPEYINITHNTFRAAINNPLTPHTSGGGFSGNLINWVNGANISYNLFENSQLYGSLNYQIAPGQDILGSAGGEVISYNYFCNLSNLTQAITDTGHDILTGNHFYWNPYLTNEFYHTNIIHIGPSSNGYDTYAIQTSGLFTIGNESPCYVFNTTIKQSGDYLYNVTPDVNTLSGTPTISYSNGLVGGPQPNFTWQGYKYTESVEPSYIQVGTNSTKAPPVDLQFNGQPFTVSCPCASFFSVRHQALWPPQRILQIPPRWQGRALDL